MTTYKLKQLIHITGCRKDFIQNLNRGRKNLIGPIKKQTQRALIDYTQGDLDFIVLYRDFTEMVKERKRIRETR